MTGKGHAAFLEKAALPLFQAWSLSALRDQGKPLCWQKLLVSEWAKLRAPSPEKGEGESRPVSSTHILWLGQGMLTGDLTDCLAWPGDLAAHGMWWLGRNQRPAPGGSSVPGNDRRGAHTPLKQSSHFPKQDHSTLELGRHHGATRQRLLNLSAAAGSGPRLFGVSCPCSFIILIRHRTKMSGRL